MGNEVIVLKRYDRALTEPMKLDLEIAIREIEKRLETLELGYQNSQVENLKDEIGIKVIQDIKQTIGARHKTIINNIMVNNIDMKSFVFFSEIRSILNLLKEKLKYCNVIETQN